jgi:hypothetical protein
MDEELGRQSRPECGDRGHGEQASPDQLGGVVERRKLSPDACPGGGPLDEVTFEVRFPEVCRTTERTKEQSNGVPENLRSNTGLS